MFDDLNFFDCWQTTCGLPSFLIDERERPGALEIEQLRLCGRGQQIESTSETEVNDTPLIQPSASFSEFLPRNQSSELAWITVSEKTLEDAPDIPEEDLDPEVTYVEEEEHNEVLVLPAGDQGGRYAAFIELQYDELGVHNIMLRMNDGSKHDFFYGCEPWGQFNVQTWSLVGDAIRSLIISYGEGKGLIKRVQINTVGGRVYDTKTLNTGKLESGPKSEKKVKIISTEWKLEEGQLGSGFIGSVSAKVDLIDTNDDAEDQFYLTDVKFGFLAGYFPQPIAGDLWESELQEEVKPRAKLFSEISPGGTEILTYREGQKFITMWHAGCAVPKAFLSIPSRVGPEKYDLLAHVAKENFVIAIFSKWFLIWDIKSGEREGIIFPMIEWSAQWLRVGKLGCHFSHHSLELLVGRAAPDLLELGIWELRRGTPQVILRLTSASVKLFARKPLRVAHTGFCIHGLNVLYQKETAVLWNGYMFLLWNTETDEKFFKSDSDSTAYMKTCSLSFDASLLATLIYEDGNSILQVLELGEQTTLIFESQQTKDGEFDPWDCSFHPRQRLLASWTTGEGRMIRFLDFDKNTDHVSNPPGQIIQVEWSSLDGYLATACSMDDGCNHFYIWDVVSATIVMGIRPGLHNLGRVNMCKFSHEGNQLMMWQSELMGSDLPMHELYSKEQLEALQEEKAALEAPKEKDAYTSTQEDMLLSMQQETEKKKKQEDSKEIKSIQKDIQTKAKSENKAKAQALGHPTKISLSKKVKTAATAASLAQPNTAARATQSEPPQSLASYVAPSDTVAQSEPLPQIKEEEEEEPALEEKQIVHTEEQNINKDIHYIVEQRVLLVKLTFQIPEVHKLREIAPIDSVRDWWIRCVAISTDGQHVIYVMSNPKGDGTKMVTIMADIDQQTVKWTQFYSMINKQDDDIKRDISKQAAHINVKIQFSEDNRYIYQVGRYNAIFVIKVFELSRGEIVLDHASPSSFQQFNTETQQSNESVSYQVILDNCIHASSLVSLSPTQHVAMLATPGHVALFGLGDRVFGPIQFRYLYGELFLDAHIVANRDHQIGVITGGWDHQFAWTLSLKREVIEGMNVVMVDRNDTDGYDEDGAGVDIIYANEDSMEIHQVDLDVDLIIQYRQVPYIIEDKLLLNNLSADGDFIFLCSKTGQVVVQKFENRGWYVVWQGFVADFPKDERVEKIVAAWLETSEERWVLMVGTVDPKDIVGTMVKFRVVEGQFSTDAKLISSTIRTSELKLKFDGLDQMDGFQRLYTKGLLHRKLLTYQYGKLGVYRRYARPDRDVWQQESELHIPPELVSQVTCCSFSESGFSVICGMRGGRVLIFKPGNVIGNIGHLGYQGLLQYSENPNFEIEPVTNQFMKPLKIQAIKDVLDLSGISMITALNMPDKNGHTLLYQCVQDANEDLFKYFIDWAASQDPRVAIYFNIPKNHKAKFTQGKLGAIPNETYKGATFEHFVHALLEYKAGKGWLFSPNSILDIFPSIFKIIAEEYPYLFSFVMRHENFMPSLSQINPLNSSTLFTKFYPQQQFNLHLEMSPMDYNTTLWPAQYLSDEKRKLYYERNNKVFFTGDEPKPELKKQIARERNFKVERSESRVILYRGASDNDVHGIIDIFANTPTNDEFLESFDSPSMELLLERKHQEFGKHVLVPELVVTVMALLGFSQYAILITDSNVTSGRYEPNITDIDADDEEIFFAIIFGLLMLLAGVYVIMERYGRSWFDNFFKSFEKTAKSKSFNSRILSIYARGFVSIFSIFAAMALQVLFFVLGDKIYVLSSVLAIYIRQIVSDFFTISQKGIYIWGREGWNLIRATSYILLLIIFGFNIVQPSNNITSINIADDFGHEAVSALSSVQFILIAATLIGNFRVFKSTGPTIQMIMEVFKESLFYIAIILVLFYSFMMSFYTLFGKELEVENTEESERDFRSIIFSFVAVVSMSMGVYDPMTYIGSKYSWLAVPLLLLFLLVLVIILFNLLISVLGDSFQRVKQLERARFQRARAEIMDEMENSLLFHKHSTSSFLHFLTPKLQDKPIEKQKWEGPMNTLIKHVRTIPGETAKIVKEDIMQELVDTIEAKLQEAKEMEENTNTEEHKK